ncbi:hypothetical protein DM02DRAFT_534841 [Periconia macrospinosa]|uniref:Rhodopsin domain-containing protein n=1 Tax=Periconia macrospinosa TaxID=97972 RepID=A0A2V1DF08_9PLEO|nr:hypothetical protein DM02DRAFT_534841 [Periconia macrospinosa]
MAFTVHEVRAIAAVLSTLATFAVAARFWVRKTLKAKYEADDWTILASTLLKLPLSNPLLKKTPTQFHFSLWLMAIACVGMIKISVLLLYRRLFFAERLFYIYVTCLCVLVALWALGFFFARIFMCGAEVSLFWNGFAVYRQKCVVYPISNGFGISDIITDGLVVLSPIPIVWRLRLPKLQRAGVVGVFALGFLSDAPRTNPIHPVGTPLLPSLMASNNLMYDRLVLGTQVAVWSVIETTVAVIAACLVTLRPLVSGEHAGALSRSIKSVISLWRRPGEGDRGEKDDLGGLRDSEEEDEASLSARVARGEAFVQV